MKYELIRDKLNKTCLVSIMDEKKKKDHCWKCEEGTQVNGSRNSGLEHGNLKSNSASSNCKQKLRYRGINLTKMHKAIYPTR